MQGGNSLLCVDSLAQIPLVDCECRWVHSGPAHQAHSEHCGCATYHDYVPLGTSYMYIVHVL